LLKFLKAGKTNAANERISDDTNNVFRPGKEGLHHYEPPEHETVRMPPESGHITQEKRDEQGYRGERDQGQPRRAQGVSAHASGIAAVPCYHTSISALICKALWA